MARRNDSRGGVDWRAVLVADDAFRELLREAVQQVLEGEIDEAVGIVATTTGVGLLAAQVAAIRTESIVKEGAPKGGLTTLFQEMGVRGASFLAERMPKNPAPSEGSSENLRDRYDQQQQLNQPVLRPTPTDDPDGRR